MNKLKIISFLFGIAFLLGGCQKDIDIFVPDAGSNGQDLKWYTAINDSMDISILRKNLLLQKQRDSFTIAGSGLNDTVRSSTGITCVFPANGIVNIGGVAVGGKVFTEMLLIKKKGDMISMDKPTISNNLMLVSGGELFIRLKNQSGEELKLKPNVKMRVTFQDTGLDGRMKLFYSSDTLSGPFSWQPFHTASGGSNVGLLLNSSSYLFESNRLHWINCDYFYNAAAQVRVVDSLPENFTNANTLSYISFTNLRSVMPVYGDPGLKKFRSPALPGGLAATVVVISKQANDYYLGHESIVTANGSSEQRVKIKPVKTSLADIKLYLSAL